MRPSKASSWHKTCYLRGMLLRFVLIISLLAAVTTLLAAPPRFSGYKTPVIPKARVDSQKGKTRQPAVVAGQIAAQSAQEAVKGKAATRKADAPRSDSKATSQAMANTPVPDESKKVESKKAKQKKREPRFSWFKRKPTVPIEKTHKQNEELVTTQDYHESKVDLLGTADLHSFATGYQEFWKVNSSKIMCSMQQNIPGYGHVEFRQGVGQPLEFALYVTYPPAGVGRAHIRIEPPEWRHFARAKDLGVIEIEPGALAVSASSEWALRLLLELSEGMRPVLRYWDAADASDQMEVLLSSLNFQEGLDLFNRCLGQVLRYDFDAVKRTIVHFHADSSKLRVKAGRQLDEILEMLNTDSGIKQIDLELYTHSKGLVRYNFRLATRRARAVRDYFIKRGISEDRIIIKIHTYKKSKLDKLGYKQSDVHIALKRKPAK